jgi:predicted nuclease of predicted toxin-antitoxin system
LTGRIMRFKIDENLPIEAADVLNQRGHDAETVFQEELNGASDTDIASACKREKRALLTLDMDFSDIRTYPPEDFFGLVILRLRHHDKNHVIEIVSRLVDILQKEPLECYLWIVEENRIRIRGTETK